MSTATNVIGLYPDAAAARQAAQALEQAGFSRADIDVTPYAADAQGAAPEQENGWDRFLEKLHLMAPKQDADFYSRGVRQGETLVTVTTTDEQADRAVDVLNQYGALDLDDRAAEFGTDAGDSAGINSGSAGAGLGTTAPLSTVGTVTDGTAIPVVEERLQVGKRQVQRGGVRVYRHVTERPVEEQVTLREERVSVDRRAVDRPATDADLAFQEGVIELTETDEEAVVAKNARVVEEVVVGKTATEHTETVRDTVRRTDVEVEEITGDPKRQL